MNISLNLRLGIWTLALLVVVINMISSYYLFTLGDSVNVILRQNVESILGAREMETALERMRVECADAALEGRPPSPDTLRRHEERFLAALAACEANITVPGETEALRRIRDAHAAGRAQTDRLLALATPEERRALLSGPLGRAHDALRAELDALVGLNRGAIERSDRATRAMAQNYSLLLGLLGMTGVAVAFHFHRRVTDSFVEPLRQISIMAQKMSHGDFSMRLPHGRADEFGTLALEVNRLLERMEMNQEESRSFAIQQRQIASALIERHEAPTLLLDNLGEVTIANAPARVILTGPDGATAAMGIRAALDAGRPFTHGGLSYRVRVEPVLTASRKMCGSLVTLELLPDKA